jgi:hypothetical protein
MPPGGGGAGKAWAMLARTTAKTMDFILNYFLTE